MKRLCVFRSNWMNVDSRQTAFPASSHLLHRTTPMKKVINHAMRKMPTIETTARMLYASGEPIGNWPTDTTPCQTATASEPNTNTLSTQAIVTPSFRRRSSRIHVASPKTATPADVMISNGTVATIGGGLGWLLMDNSPTTDSGTVIKRRMAKTIPTINMALTNPGMTGEMGVVVGVVEETKSAWYGLVVSRASFMTVCEIGSKGYIITDKYGCSHVNLARPLSYGDASSRVI